MSLRRAFFSSAWEMEEPERKRKAPDWPWPSEEMGSEAKKLEISINLIEILPIEILGDLMLRLPLGDIARFCRVSKRVDELCNSRPFWKALYWGDIELSYSLEELRERMAEDEREIEAFRTGYRWINTHRYFSDPEKFLSTTGLVNPFNLSVSLSVETEDRNREVYATHNSIVSAGSGLRELYVEGRNSISLTDFPNWKKIMVDRLMVTGPGNISVPGEIGYPPVTILDRSKARSVEAVFSQSESISLSIIDEEIFSDRGYDFGFDLVWVTEKFRERVPVEREYDDVVVTPLLFRLTIPLEEMDEPEGSAPIFRVLTYLKYQRELNVYDPTNYPPPLDPVPIPEEEEEEIPLAQPDYEMVERAQIFRRRLLWGSADLVDRSVQEPSITVEPLSRIITAEREEEDRYSLVRVKNRGYPDDHAYVSIYDEYQERLLCRKNHTVPEDLMLEWLEYHWKGPELQCPYCIDK